MMMMMTKIQILLEKITCYLWGRSRVDMPIALRFISCSFDLISTGIWKWCISDPGESGRHSSVYRGDQKVKMVIVTAQWSPAPFICVCVALANIYEWSFKCMVVILTYWLFLQLLLIPQQLDGKMNNRKRKGVRKKKEKKRKERQGERKKSNDFSSFLSLAYLHMYLLWISPSQSDNPLK